MIDNARRWAGLAALGLVAAMMPAIGLSAAATAATGCEHEYNADASGLFPSYTCDDTTQPDTTVHASVTPNAAGWVNKNSVTFTFAAVDPGDQDLPTMSFRCTFTGPSKSFTEKTCTSPLTVDGLSDSDQSYTFSVYAVDDGGPSNLNGDNEVTNSPLDFVTPKEVVTKDYDESAASFSWKQDTSVPMGQIAGGPYDEYTPDLPVLWGATTLYVLGSNEPGAKMSCRLDGAARTCAPGALTLSGLTPGTHTLTMRVRDKADNVDPVTHSARFTVAYNKFGTATEQAKWRRVVASGFVGNDYWGTRVKYNQLSRSVSNIKEVRVTVPVGPGLGVLRVKLGDVFLPNINEAASKPGRRMIVIRGPQTKAMSGLLKFYALDNRPVRFDAIMYR